MNSYGHLQPTFEENVIPLCLTLTLFATIVHADFEVVPSPENSKGLTYDECRTQSFCVSPRLCVNSSNFTVLCNAELCRCVPPVPTFCTASEECAPGEVCVLIVIPPHRTAPHCASSQAIEGESDIFKFFRANGTGLTGDSCGVTDACRPPRLCISNGTVCNGNRICHCIPPNLQPCSASNQCITGERCLMRGKLPICQSSETKGVEWNSSRGLTFDFCRSSEECTGGRRCGTGKQREECKEGVVCHCRRNWVQLCLSNDFCEDGEICASYDGGRPGLCISEQAAPYQNVKLVQPALGLLNEVCIRSEHCKPPRECRSEDTFEPCIPGSICVCIAPGKGGCEGNVKCLEGESCVLSNNEPRCLKTSAALDEGLVPVGEIFDDANQTRPALTLPVVQRKCIATHLLGDLDEDDLVFDEDVLAHVLCDEANNCATPGHIVISKGKAMMMKSHCSHVGCVKRVMAVNSPKFKKRLRIKGLTSELEFSALAAQYGTRAEELFLTFMVRFGL